MKAHTKHQVVTHNGTPVAVVLPYADYLSLLEKQTDEHEDIPTDKELETARNDTATIPHEVMGFIISRKMSPVRAWREHLELTQKEVAERMGVKQATFARMESGKVALRISTLKNIAKAMKIDSSMLELEDLSPEG